MPAGQVISTNGFIPRKFTNMSLVETMRLSNLITSGAITRSPKLDQFMSKGGVVFDMPFWNDLQTGTGAEGTADVDRQSFEGLSQDHGTLQTVTPSADFYRDPIPNGLTSAVEVGVRLCRNNSWGASDLSESLIVGGPSAMEIMSSRTGPYKALTLQRLFLTTLAGIFADNDAAPDASEHVAGDLTLDISGSTYSPGYTDFSAAANIRALQLLGDSKAAMVRNGVILMHSIVTATIALKDLVETIRDSEGRIVYQTFQGMRIVENDELTSPSPGVYDTYYVGPGAFLFGSGMPKNPVEFDRKPGAGNGGGATVMYHRWEWCLHPVGHAWQVASTGPGPTYAQIATGTSWKRVYPERKHIRLIRVRSREHNP